MSYYNTGQTFFGETFDNVISCLVVSYDALTFPPCRSTGRRAPGERPTERGPATEERGGNSIKSNRENGEMCPYIVESRAPLLFHFLGYFQQDH